MYRERRWKYCGSEAPGDLVLAFEVCKELTSRLISDPLFDGFGEILLRTSHIAVWKKMREVTILRSSGVCTVSGVINETEGIERFSAAMQQATELIEKWMFTDEA